MDEKKKRMMTILLLAVNAVVWVAFIVPNISNISQAIIGGESQTLNLPVIDSSAAKKENVGHIDFKQLRDPFTLPGGIPKEFDKGSGSKQNKPSDTVKNQGNQNSSGYPPNKGTVQNTFVSRFKLKGISKINDKYVATIEESSHYGSSDSSTPYSYKWDSSVNSGSGGKSYTVYEGDEILGERVVRIGADFVILAKNKMYYKLTFSGGYSISDLK
ncbi:MAG: hypothetical protein A2Y33_05530 [Spirochaetes bacterium GWF1_51_8]|nr:MAG: hypothetical protein A2Y33_05530 [Spirochaetes bacterium GWF1_51_8]